jgi:hypothetical protein
MNRLKLIVLSSALSLITVGVFAGKDKFVNYTLWYNPGSGAYQQITSGFTSLTNLNMASGSDVSISGSASKALYISTDNGTTFSRAKTTIF